MNVETLVPVFIVAILSVIGNIIFFRYQFKKDKKWKILNQQLTELLLPLFYLLKSNDLEISEWQQSENVTEDDFIATLPERLLKKITPLIKNNLYLADDELHIACIKFLEWAHDTNTKERYEKMHEKLPDDNIFFEFRDLIYEKYEKSRKKYLNK